MKKLLPIIIGLLLVSCGDDYWSHLDSLHYEGDIAEVHTYKITMPDAANIETIDPFGQQYLSTLWKYNEDGFNTRVEYYEGGQMTYYEENTYYDDYSIKSEFTYDIVQAMGDSLLYSKPENNESTLQRNENGVWKDVAVTKFDEKGRMIETRNVTGEDAFTFTRSYDQNDDMVLTEYDLGEVGYTINLTYKDHDLQELVYATYDGTDTYVETHKDYKYDENGNWIEKWIYRDGELIEAQFQKFVYR